MQDLSTVVIEESFIESIRYSKAQNTDSALADYEMPLLTVDIVVFTVVQNRLKVLLIKRNKDPYTHMWAIPGGFIHSGELLIEAAQRRLYEETNVSNIYLEQLHTFGRPDRDPRHRVITVAFFALISAEKLKLEVHSDAEDVRWFCVKELPELAFDHEEILQYAIRKLKQRLETTPVAFQLLPEKFTLTELQRVNELILEKTLDKRNFRKKILAESILQDTGETKMEGFHRPAQLYSFRALRLDEV